MLNGVKKKIYHSSIVSEWNEATSERSSILALHSLNPKGKNRSGVQGTIDFFIPTREVEEERG